MHHSPAEGHADVHLQLKNVMGVPPCVLVKVRQPNDHAVRCQHWQDHVLHLHACGLALDGMRGAIHGSNVRCDDIDNALLHEKTHDNAGCVHFGMKNLHFPVCLAMAGAPLVLRGGLRHSHLGGIHACRLAARHNPGHVSRGMFHLLGLAVAGTALVLQGARSLRHLGGIHACGLAAGPSRGHVSRGMFHLRSCNWCIGSGTFN
mmetsp:Transcript_67338/g.209126  ORF Transcript_67338/g.209126 Transcript_67338/m.209126 type:complete len:204 (-) Transcript_67338:917-1528(-)